MKGQMTGVPGFGLPWPRRSRMASVPATPLPSRRCAEIAEREHAAAEYAAMRLSSQAERLHTEAGILTAVIAAVDQDH